MELVFFREAEDRFPEMIAAFLHRVIDETQAPRGHKGAQKHGTYLLQNKPTGLPKGEVRGRIDIGEEQRNEQRGDEVRKEGKGRQVLNTAAQLARDDRRSGGRRHQETEHQALRQGFGAEGVEHNPGKEGQHQLHRKNHPMPDTQTQVEGVDLAEGEEQHQEEQRTQEKLHVDKSTPKDHPDDHSQREGVGVNMALQGGRQGDIRISTAVYQHSGLSA